MTVRELKHEQTPLADVVERCEWLLERARNGTLRGIVFAVVLDETANPNMNGSAYAGELRLGPMVCVLEGAKLRMLGYVPEVP